MWRAYFKDRNYALLYAHSFGHRIATSLIGIFSGVFLYSLGMPLPFVLLFFGLEFGLRGVVASIAPAIVARLGLRRTLVLSYAFLLSFFVLIGLSQFSLVLGFLSFILHSLSLGIYHPCIDTLHSLLVKDGTRGKEMSFEFTLGILAGLIALAIGSSALIQAFLPVAVALAAVLVLSVTPLFFMRKLSFSHNIRTRDTYHYIASPAYRENLLPLGASSLVIIANIIAAPLFVFVLVPEPAAFSLIILIGMLIQALFTLMYGSWIDKWGNKRTLGGASLLQAMGNFGYLFVSHGAPFLPFLVGLNNTARSMWLSNFITRMQEKAEKSRSSLLFNASTQMTLCFVEIFALGAFALVAWRWGNVVFPVIFIGSIAGLYVSNKYFRD